MVAGHLICAGFITVALVNLVGVLRVKRGFNPVVFTFKSTYLQRIADYAQRGYYYHLKFSVAQNKLSAVLNRFDSLYGCGASKYDREKRKRLGIANATLLLYQPRKSQGTESVRVEALLLVQSGENLAFARESLKDMRVSTERLIIDDLELVLLPRAERDTPSWTWRFEKTRYQELRNKVVHLAKTDLGRLEVFLNRCAKTPGFAGVRQQLKLLCQLAKSSVKRYQQSNAAIDTPRIYYVRRLPNPAYHVSDLI